MFASTQFLFAFPPSPAFASAVARCSESEDTVTSVAAFTTVTPAVDEVICTVQEPVASTVVHVFVPPTKLPGPLTIEKLINVPAGAFTKPVPSFTFTCPVNVWFVPAALSAVAGQIWMFPSTQFLFAFPPSPTFESPVARCTVMPVTTVTSVAAFTTVTPGVAEVICTVQEPVASTVVQVLTPPTKLPGPLTLVKVINVPAGALTKPVPSFTFTCPVNV